MFSRPFASVCMITYNHEKYISQSIESILMQKTTFPYELVIGEDFSQDNTRKICLDYKKRFPETISLRLSKRNLGPVINFFENLKSCLGKYIAFCEGDDYWIDPYKLQKQIDFLEKNKDFSLCFHNTLIFNESRKFSPKYFCPTFNEDIFFTENVINNYFIHTSSMVCRKTAVTELPSWVYEIYNGDWGLQMIVSTKGKIKYLDEVMSIYRKNDGALSGGPGKNTEFINLQKIKLLTFFNEYTDFYYKDLINTRTAELLKQIKAYKLRKSSKFLYSLVQPRRTIIKLLNKLSRLLSLI